MWSAEVLCVGCSQINLLPNTLRHTLTHNEYMVQEGSINAL